MKAFLIGLWVLAAVSFSSCSVNSAKNQYLLAEKLWTDGKYAAAVNEFDKVAAKDPRGTLGLQAIYRAAMTQAFFLSQYSDAIRKFQKFVEVSSDAALIWEVQKEIGELLFSKMEQYEAAIQHYQSLLKARPDAPDAPEFQFRIAKSRFYLWQFDEAVRGYRSLIKKYPDSSLAEKASYEIGVAYFTRGEQRPGGYGPGTDSYQEAIDAFQRFLKKYPQSPKVAEARFGIASCMEELDQLDAAYHAYEALKDSYPSRNVVEIKLARIRDRKAQRSR